MTTLELHPTSGSNPIARLFGSATSQRKKTHEYQANSPKNVAPRWLIDSLRHMSWNSALDIQTMSRVDKMLQDDKLSYDTALKLQQALIYKIQKCEQDRKQTLRERIAKRLYSFPEYFLENPHGQEVAYSLACTLAHKEASWEQLKTANIWSETIVDTWLAVGNQ